MSLAATGKPSKGIIFGFDLDQTLIDSHGLKQSDLKDYETARKFIDSRINQTILDYILHTAINYRRLGYIDAIFLLTNNGDRKYVAFVSRYISDTLKGRGTFGQIRNTPYGNSQMPDFGDKVGYFFDYVMVRQHASRGGTEDPSKSLKDIKYMINALKETRFKDIKFSDDKDLASRTYFFDDRSQHRIRNELTDFGYPENYIQITGPDYFPPPNDSVNMGFIHGKDDLSDYRPIFSVFKSISASIQEARVAEHQATIKAEQEAFNTRLKTLQKPIASAKGPLNAAALQAAAKSITENPVVPRGTLNLLKARVAQRQGILPTHLQSYSRSGNTPPRLSRAGQASLLSLPPSATRTTLGTGTRANRPIGSISSGFGGKRRRTYKNRKNRTTRRKRSA
jgi:hypothetical protein